MGARTKASKSGGFTLIEAIISIVILSVSMISLISFLFPQIEDSARPQYEVRASVLAHSMMTEILSRGYAHNSDPDGGLVRCGENGTTCTVPLGPDGISEINAGQRSPENFNDVDDYIGCWYTNTYSQSNCTETAVGSLTDVLGANISNEYSNFAANVTVVEETIDGTSEFKKISVSIVAGKYGSYTFHAHRGNY